MKLKWQPLFLGYCALLTVMVIACIQVSPQSTAPQQANNSTDISHCGSRSGGPTNNPVGDLLGDQAPAWTTEIRWGCVYNVADYPGTTAQTKLRVAMTDASQKGGGVVYLPAGDYTFTDSLFLESNVVLRGADPITQDAKSSEFRPPTRLNFPKYEPSFSGQGTPNDTAFKSIGLLDPDTASNVGLVFLDINRAEIAWSGDPDVGTMRNRLIFGVRSNNVAEPDPNVPNLEFQPGWTRYSYRFAANIRLTTQQNALVANNRLNDALTDTYEQPGYVVQSRDRSREVTYAQGDRVPFRYSDHYGIVVNRSKPGGFKYADTPSDEPGLFREGIVIRDNWVFKTMRVGIHASGEGLLIANNEIYDDPDKVAWTGPTGQKQPSGATTLENRAIDWSGHTVEIVNNRYQVYRHQIMDSDYRSNDGEGILAQQCCGGTSIDGLTLRGNQGRGYIGLYKIPDIQRVVIQQNEVRALAPNQLALYVNADTNAAAHAMFGVHIEENTIFGKFVVQSSAGGDDNRILNNRGEGTLIYSCHVQVAGNRGFREEPCQQ